jgi:hypothetical protein
MSDTKHTPGQKREGLEKMADDLISEDWLRSVGFKWHQFNRQNTKQWLLWCGITSGESWTDTQDIGIEVCENTGLGKDWFCWLRSDYAHRYSRFIHVRHIKTQRELILLVEAVTGLPWNPANHRNGCVLTDEQAERARKEAERLDQVMLRENPKWREIEKDDTMGGALPEHRQIVENLPMEKRDEGR